MTTNDARTPVEYELADLGIDDPQSFQGVSTVFTSWDSVFVGAGNTPHEAAEEALEDAALMGWDVDNVENDLSNDADETDLHASDCPMSHDASADCDGYCDLFYYAAVYLK